MICAKVARYAERVHHPDRLHAVRCGAPAPRAAASSRPISWDDALDSSPKRSSRAEQAHGSEAVWPYYYAGTMGFVMRDGINRLRHAKKYSGFHSTICVNPAWTGFIAGTGKLAGADPREMAKSDLVVIWGTNAVNTQVNVMTHATRARKERGAKIVVVDVYMNATMRQADLPMLIRPGTDGALACAVMHCLFRDGKADWDYLDRYTDAPRELEAHLRSRGPAWASRITGCPVETIEAFARLVGETKRAYFRLGYGFSRSRNGAANMHAASCIAGGHRRLAPRRRRRLPPQRRDLPPEQERDRRQRRARSFDPHARPVAHRRDPHRRRGRAARRAAGDGAAHPEHQSGRRSRPIRRRSSAALPATICSSACTSSS